MSHGEIALFDLIFHEDALDVWVTSAFLAAPASVFMELDGALAVLQQFEAWGVAFSLDE